MSSFKVKESKGEFVAVNAAGKYVTTDAGKFVIFNAETNSFRQVDEIIDADGNSFHTNSEDLSDFAGEVGEDEADEIAAAKEYWCTPVNVDGASDVTELLLQVLNRKEFIEQFKSPKIKRKDVWQQVSQCMADFGFPANAGSSNCDSGRKCNQKWTNLVKSYNKYQKVLGVGGPPRRPPPRYYNMIENVLKQIKQTNHLFITNSLPSASNSLDSSMLNNSQAHPSSDLDDMVPISSMTVSIPSIPMNANSPPRSPSSCSSSSDSLTKFSRRKTKRKGTVMQAVIKTLKEEMRLQTERHQQQQKLLEDFIRNSEKSREQDMQLKIRMVSAIEKVCQAISRKRKHDSSDDLDND